MTHLFTSLNLIDIVLGLAATAVGCLVALVFPGDANAWIGLIVAATGMITALGTVSTSLLRLWAEHRRNDLAERVRALEAKARKAEHPHGH